MPSFCELTSDKLVVTESTTADLPHQLRGRMSACASSVTGTGSRG